MKIRKELEIEMRPDLRRLIEPLVQLVIPGFNPPPEPEETRYICECGGSTWSIRAYHVECVSCHTRYEDCAMPPESFNEDRESLIVPRGRYLPAQEEISA